MALLEQNRVIPPEGRGLLAAIRGPEASGQYDVIYGGRHFNNMSHHPHVSVPIQSGPNQGQTSSAAGAYQFLAPTWDDISKRYGLQDFSAPSQDYGAWMLANEVYRKKTGGDLTEALKAGKLQDVAHTLSGTWTSLSGGIEAQPNGSGRGLLANYQAGLGQIPGSAPIVSAELQPPAVQSNEIPADPAEQAAPAYDRSAMKGLLASLMPQEAAAASEPSLPRLQAPEAPPAAIPKGRGVAFRQLTVKTKPFRR